MFFVFFWYNWKIAYNLTRENHGISDTLRWLADKPNKDVLKYHAYKINGVQFYTKARDNVRSVQNSGVRLFAKTMQVASAKDKNPFVSSMWFYGVIQEIWVLDYTKFRIPVFKCDWVADSGIKVDELGFTLVNLSKVDHKHDQFVVATHAKQVFYIEDPLDSRWSVVVLTPDRDYRSCDNDEELGNNLDDHQPFSRGLPDNEVFDDLVDGISTNFMRADCEDIWIDEA